MSSCGFSRHKDDHLIRLVRANPIIYSPHHEHFKNIIMKHKVWEDISAALQVSVADAKKRWRHFRDHYIKKLKMQQHGMLNGKPPWERMQQLNFLAEIGVRRMTILPPEHVGGGDDADAAAHDVETGHHSDCDSEDSSRKRRKYSSDGDRPPEWSAGGERAPEWSAGGERAPEWSAGGERSAVHKLFESLADIVAQFPPRLAAETRLQVCRLVTDAELSLLDPAPATTGTGTGTEPAPAACSPLELYAAHVKSEDLSP